ncbi:hypothetical protein SSX86_011361 [Deinandra increscens subsp. villosa]|uniref:J domain-containing protein n=1 Tax=Deinandra increscens subsp. villosa TaxID=3103831 RepID=A0AAP0DAY2_9ASTR
MECNKDEALRAKKIAEEKMVNNDFEGARKIALKAKQLFPELDNISQLITVCEIHCVAQKKIYGSAKDLYAILQVDNVADETTIRKQYRKLALLLHPDKNKFPGAEAAFKLVGEANMTLSDKGKRSIYDIKCREPAAAFATKIQNSQKNQTSYAGQQTKAKTVPSSQFNGANHGQQTTSKASIRLTFWTYCPFCQSKYEYLREFVNKALRCQHCSKLFIGYDIGPQGPDREASFVNGKVQNVNLGPKPVSQQKKGGEVGKGKGKKQKDGQFSSNFDHKRTEDTRMKQEGVTKPKVNSVQKPTVTAKGTHKKRGRKVAAESRETSSDKKEAAGVGVSDGSGAKDKNKKRGRTMAAESRETCSAKKEAAGVGVSDGSGAKDTNTKRGRMMAEESSPTSSDVKEAACGGVSGGPDGDSLNRRRSYREKQQVSYQENGGGEFSPQKRSKLRKSSNDAEDMKTEAVSGCVDKSDVAAADASTPKSKPKVNGEAVTPNNHSNSDSDPEFVDCPDQDFTNFDKDKEEHCFAVGQIWACYDSVDSMPRFYAQIRKVYSSKFRLRITWLESEPDNILELKWAEEGLPVGCGDFQLAETEETSDRLMFSHQIVVKKGATKSSYVISPQKGEIWAIYKNWDINWSSDPENHTKYKFDVVEILEVDNDCISVDFLLKVKGFVSVFQRSLAAGIAQSKFPSNERFRFSHRIPSAKLTGTERAGVPAGSLELDMASLPADFEDYCSYFSNKADTDYEEKVKPTANLASTPKKHMNCVDKDALKPRRSPRGLKIPKQES